MSNSISSPILHTPAMAFVGEWAVLVPTAMTFLHRLGMTDAELIAVFRLGEYLDRLPVGLLVKPEDLDVSNWRFAEPNITSTNIVLDVEPLNSMLQAISEINHLIMEKTEARTFLDDVYWEVVMSNPLLKGKPSFSDWLPDPTLQLQKLKPYFEGLKMVQDKVNTTWSLGSFQKFEPL